MKTVYMIIGTMLVLALCITPVAAFTGEEYIVVIDDSGDIPTYKYFDKSHPDYFPIIIFTEGTNWLKSLVTLKPANIPDAPVMVVDTNNRRYIELPRSVDKWEIKYYSRFGINPSLSDKYLKNAGVVDLREDFNPWYRSGGYLYLMLSEDQYLWGYVFYYVVPPSLQLFKYYIPEVK